MVAQNSKRGEKSMATPKKKKVKAEKVESKVTRKYTFKSRDASVSHEMAEPMKGNKASEVLFQVLNKGASIPEGIKLQYAPSYKGHFIALKGKNACGASAAPNILVVNGIAKELEEAGVEGIVQPTAKPYKAIDLKEVDSKGLKELANHIAMVLGFTTTKKKASKKKVAKKTVKVADVIDEVAGVMAEDLGELA